MLCMHCQGPHLPTRSVSDPMKTSKELRLNANQRLAWDGEVMIGAEGIRGRMNGEHERKACLRDMSTQVSQSKMSFYNATITKVLLYILMGCVAATTFNFFLRIAVCQTSRSIFRSIASSPRE